MREPSVLADQTIVERKGENRLDRQVHQVIHHGSGDATDPAPEAEPSETTDADVERQELVAIRDELLDRPVSLPDDQASLGTELPKEMARIRDIVIPQYQSIGPAGSFAIALMKERLDRAAKAMAEGDLLAMISCYRQLKDFKS